MPKLPYPLRDHVGQIIPPGRVQQTLEWSGIQGAFPSWLTTSDATFTPVAANAGVPGMRVEMTGAAWAQMNVGGDILRDDRLAATSLRVTGVQSLGGAGAENWNTLYLHLENTASTDGAQVGSNCGSPNADDALIVRGVGTGTSGTIALPHRAYRNLTDANLADPPKQVFRTVNLGLMVNWQQKAVYVFDGDQVVGAYDGTTLLTTTGTITPRVRMKADVNHAMLISGVRLDCWYY